MKETKKDVKKLKKHKIEKKQKSTKQVESKSKTKSKRQVKQIKKIEKPNVKSSAKKINFALLIIIPLIIIFFVGLLIFFNVKKEIETDKKLAVESVKNLENNEMSLSVNEREDLSKYSLQDFADILKEYGASVGIENIGGGDNKEYRCLVAISNGIYEEFGEDEWTSPIVMTIQGFNGSEILVSAKKFASDEKIVYCDWYIDDKSYQVIAKEVIDIADFLDALYKYIIATF